MTNHTGRFRLTILPIALLMVLFTYGCAPSEGSDVMLDEKDNGRTIKLSQNRKLLIQLESNPSTGYSWVVLDIDPTILNQVGQNEYAPQTSTEGMVLGSGGKEKLSFRAAAKGTTTLKLGYKQPWDAQALPEKTFSVEVTVR